MPAVGATVTPQQAHVVLFVSDSAAPLTGAELARLRAAVEGCPMTVFVQTKIDACAGWRDVLNRNIALMRDAGLDEVRRDRRADPLVVLAAQVAEALAARPRCAAQRQRARAAAGARGDRDDEVDRAEDAP